MPPLATAFHQMLQRHAVTEQSAQDLWQEVVSAYGAANRHYHTLQHLEDVHAGMAGVWSQLDDADAVLLAIVYHDMVYRADRNDNEERSADLMRERMLHVGLPAQLVERAARHILATKNHAHNPAPDTDLFTDADLSILGAPAVRYAEYAKQVRREFKNYPDLLYRPGRRKVLKHFLAMPQLFKTPYFRERFEEQAPRWRLDSMGLHHRQGSSTHAVDHVPLHSFAR